MQYFEFLTREPNIDVHQKESSFAQAALTEKGERLLNETNQRLNSIFLTSFVSNLEKLEVLKEERIIAEHVCKDFTRECESQIDVLNLKLEENQRLIEGFKKLIKKIHKEIINTQSDAINELNEKIDAGSNTQHIVVKDLSEKMQAEINKKVRKILKRVGYHELNEWIQKRKDSCNNNLLKIVIGGIALTVTFAMGGFIAVPPNVLWEGVTVATITISGFIATLYAVDVVSTNHQTQVETSTKKLENNQEKYCHKKPSLNFEKWMEGVKV